MSTAHTAAPDVIVPVLYDRLIGALRRAAVECATKRVSELALEIEAASGAVYELLGTLNFREGGELTPRLAALYGYFASEILVLSHSADERSIDQLREMVEILSGQWRRDDKDERQHYLRNALLENPVPQSASAESIHTRTKLSASMPIQHAGGTS
ncbi:hypothetical protein BH09GEM1_BH09GEM1_12430 [soil metagenome]